MTKDPSRRSSVAGSSHIPSPRENGIEPPAPELADTILSSATSNVSTAVLVDVNTSQAAPEADRPVMATAEQSHPMTASNSTSSNPTALDTGATVPYGTRSRNRNGTSRPNYAEDKELDLELEAALTGKDSNGARNKVTRVDPVVNSEGRTSNHSWPNTTESDLNGTVHGNHKEPIPGTSTFSANPTSNGNHHPSKKRKAPGQPIIAAGPDSQARTVSQNVPAAQTITRRASIATQVPGFRDSNMLSFEGCGCRLKAQKLVADDGTILQINGKSS